jgi:hypothetical protein
MMTGIRYRTRRRPTINIRRPEHALHRPNSRSVRLDLVDDAAHAGRSGVITAFYDVARIESCAPPRACCRALTSGGAVNVISNPPTQEASKATLTIGKTHPVV